MFVPATKYARISRAFAFDKSKFNFFLLISPCCVGLAVRFLRRKMWEAQQKSSKCAGQKYFLSEDLPRAAELQVGSTVSRVLWDEIRKSNNRCSGPGENYSRGLRKWGIPARFFALLDTIGATCHVMSKWPLELLLSGSFYLNSQSTLYGRNGSNACTFIALVLAKFYSLRKSALSLSKYMSHVLNWINLFINCISLGNHTHDSIITGIGRYFSVQEVTIPFLGLITGNVQLEAFFDLSILNENPMVPHSSLGFYLKRLTKEGNLDAVVIMNGMTISQVGQNNNIIVIGGHLHGQLGAMVGIISVDKVEELLIFVEQH